MIRMRGLYSAAMPRESRIQARARVVRILDALAREMPDARIQLDFGTPIQLLVSVILSAQCTDVRVNQVTPALFARYPDVAAFAHADRAELENLIRTCGLYRAKAKAIVSAARAILEEHGGVVPSSREELEQLPGVGPKTAGVVAIHLGPDFALPVDTHVRRLAKRMGLTTETAPDRVERRLQELIQRERWTEAHHLLIWHGRRTCTARSPACDRCVVRDLCPKFGVVRRRDREGTTLALAARRAARR
jgi:endonuclease III